MNNYAKTLLKVPCRQCGAEIGEPCTGVMDFDPAHPARIAMRPMTRAVLDRIPIPKLHIKGEHPAYHCKRNEHKRCTGSNPRRVYISLDLRDIPCTCSCHAPKIIS